MRLNVLIILEDLTEKKEDYFEFRRNLTETPTEKPNGIDNIIDQINADATIADGSIVAGMLAAGSVTFAKLNQNVLDVMVRRALRADKACQTDEPTAA